MPYIKQERRPDLDPILQKLWNELVVIKGGADLSNTLDKMKGDVNYCFTKILVTMLKKLGTRYHVLSNIHAIPVDVANEFKDVFMRPYEDKKKAENGEIEPLIT